MKKLSVICAFAMLATTMTACKSPKVEMQEQSMDATEQNVKSPIDTSQYSDLIEIDGSLGLDNGVVLLTGLVTKGTFLNEDKATLLKQDGTIIQITVSDFETETEMQEQVSEGDSVGMVVSGITIDDVTVGDYIYK